jgi:hypothetical protein
VIHQNWLLFQSHEKSHISLGILSLQTRFD